jgi:uncharacterized membrane protein
MNMIKYIIPFVVTIVSTAAIDYVWLGVIMKDFYVKELGKAIVPNIPAAIGVYVAMALLIFVFVLPVAGPSYLRVIGFGALFGLLTYAFYDLTNLAILSTWTTRLAAVDIAWGTILCAAVSVIAYSLLK